MNQKFINVKYKLANQASSYPSIYTTISRILTGRNCYTTKKTDIVIDGYPRSGNTYATYAFIAVQKSNFNVANHIQKKSQFLLAEKYGIPAILLIRQPLETISSLLIRQPQYDPETLLEGYYFLYSGLKNHNSYIVAPFDKLINNYGSIIQKVNDKYGTNFDLYEKTNENEEKVKQIVQTQDELKNASDYAQRVAYP
ncbi:MAG: hypothetical protein WBO44_03200, partial [Saprospiraceae bacterium]